MCLTVADSGKKNLTLNGPPGLEKFWRATARFMYRPDLAVRLHENTQYTVTTCKESYVYSLPLQDKPEEVSQFSYICETFPTPGKFDIQKAKELNIPRGPLYAHLKKGEDVTLPDGRFIKSETVVAPSTPGRSIAIVCSVADDQVNQLVQLVCWKK